MKPVVKNNPLKIESSDIIAGGYAESFFLLEAFSLLRPPEKISSVDWAAKYRYISPEASANYGKFNPLLTPYFLAYYHVLDSYGKITVVAMKASQIGFTEVLNNILGRRVHHSLGSALVLFPNKGKAYDFSREKFKPMVDATPVLKESLKGKLSLDRQTWHFIVFKGGFIKFLTGASVSSMKSTSAPALFVEEPDDIKQNVGGQGHGIEGFSQRSKTYDNSILSYGGTPTIEGASNVAEAYENSNQMEYHVPCHECGEFHVLSFDYLKTPKYSGGYLDPIYGENDLNNAYYFCPHCGSIWSFEQKNINVRKAIESNFYGWVAKRPESPVYGFHFSELLSPFAGSSFYHLEKSRLDAEIALAEGKEGKMISYINNRRGLPYKPSVEVTLPQHLKEAAQDYEHGIVPKGGIICTAEIDVQHDRFSVTIHAHGRFGNIYLIAWEEIYGNVKDSTDAVWDVLYKYLTTPVPYLSLDSGITLPIINVRMDVGDGTMSSVLYQNIIKFYTKTPKLVIFPTKGWNESAPIHEIYESPKSVGKSDTVASKYGLTVYMVGTQKGKGEIMRRLALPSTATKDRYYYPIGVSDEFYMQITSNTLVRRGNRPPVFRKNGGARDEVLDCAVMTLHARYSLNLHVWGEQKWQLAEQRLLTTTQKPRELLEPIGKPTNA